MINEAVLKENIRQIQKEFQKFASPRAMQRILKASFETPMEMVRAPAESNAPRLTGRLKARVRAKSYFIKPNIRWAANIYTDAWGQRDTKTTRGLGAYYGLWVEQGHRIVPPGGRKFARSPGRRVNYGRTKGSFFMERAWDSVGGRATDMAMNEMAKRILNTIKRGKARAARGG